MNTPNLKPFEKVLTYYTKKLLYIFPQDIFYNGFVSLHLFAAAIYFLQFYVLVALIVFQNGRRRFQVSCLWRCVSISSSVVLALSMPSSPSSTSLPRYCTVLYSCKLQFSIGIATFYYLCYFCYRLLCCF